MKIQTFRQGVAIFVRHFPEKSFSAEILWLYLKDLEDSKFISAINKIVMTKLEINRATNIIALIRSHALPDDMTAPEAWNEVLKEVRRVGSWGIPSFSLVEITKAVDCIGWKTICMSENIGIERAHFFKAFDAISQRERLRLAATTNTKELISTVSANLPSLN